MSAILERIIDDAQALGDAEKLGALDRRWIRRLHRAVDMRHEMRGDICKAVHMAFEHTHKGISHRLAGRIADAWKHEQACDGWVRHLERIRVELKRRKA